MNPKRMNDKEAIEAKLDRATEHIRFIEEFEKSYQRGGSNCPLRYDPKVKRWKFAVSKILLPERIAIIAGEAIHQMRCCLDYVVWSFVESQNLTLSEGQQRRIYFPVYVCADKFRKWNVAGLTREYRAVIESVQPYATGIGQSDPLFILSKLDNITKHRRLTLLASEAEVSYPDEVPASAKLPFDDPSYSEEDADIQISYKFLLNEAIHLPSNDLVPILHLLHRHTSKTFVKISGFLAE